MNKLNWKFLIALIAFGIGLIWVGRDYIKDSKAVAENYENITPTTIHAGMIVEGDLIYNLGIFEETYIKVFGIKAGGSDYLFLVPIGSQYMGFQSRTKEMTSALDIQTDETINALQGGKTQPSKVHFKGRIVQMSSDDTFYAKDYFMSAGYSETEASNLICNFIIQPVDYNDGVKFVGFGVLCLLIAIFMVAKPLRESLAKRSVRQSLEGQLNRQSVNYLYSDDEPKQAPEIRRDPFEEAVEEDYMNRDYAQSQKESSDSTSSGGLRLKQ